MSQSSAFSYMGEQQKFFNIHQTEKKFSPIMAKPKIIPIKSSVIRKIQERQNKLLIQERMNKMTQAKNQGKQQQGK